MNSMFYFLIVIFFIANISIAFIPYWTRKTECFGVSIPEDMFYRADFKTMRKSYTGILAGLSILLLGVFILAGINLEENITIHLFTWVSIAYFIVSFLLYLPFHFKMKRIKENENWTQIKQQVILVDTNFHQEKLVYSARWFLIPAAIIVGTAIYTYIMYETIPEQIPIHTSINGVVTYDDKSVGLLIMMPVMQLFMLKVSILVHYIIKQSKQQVSVNNPESSRKQNIIFRKKWSLYTIILAIILTLLFTFIQLTYIYPELIVFMEPVALGTTALVLIGTIILSINTGQGGSRIKLSSSDDTDFIERDDDRFWKLGQFYFNKNDPAIFIEKRFGIGWTNNWAHPVSWIITIAVIALPFVLVYFLI